MAVRKSINQVGKKLSEKIDIAGEYWLNKAPADLGNHAGVVKVPNSMNMVYARLTNGQVVEVFNNIAPNIYNWKVFIGRDKSQPTLLKVLEVRWVYNMAATVAYVLFHHGQHEFPAPDTVWVYRDQFLPLLVLPNGGLHVRLYGDLLYTTGMTNPIRISNISDIDLSSHAVASGARYVLMEILTNGTIDYVTGDLYGSIDILRSTAPFPAPTEGAFPVCVIEFYEGQIEIRRDSTVRNIIDLRMFTSNVAVSAGPQIHTSPAGTPTYLDEFGYWDIATNTLKKITWNDMQTILVTRIAMDPVLSDPPVPVLNTTGDDYVYY